MIDTYITLQTSLRCCYTQKSLSCWYTQLKDLSLLPSLFFEEKSHFPTPATTWPGWVLGPPPLPFLQRQKCNLRFRGVCVFGGGGGGGEGGGISKILVQDIQSILKNKIESISERYPQNSVGGVSVHAHPIIHPGVRLLPCNFTTFFVTMAEPRPPPPPLHFQIF
jgi:hypothetical protein